MAIVGLGIKAAHEAAATAFEAHGPIKEVRVLLLVQSARAPDVNCEGLLRALGCSRAARAVQGTALQLKADVQRVPWETAEEGVEDPSPRGRLLIIQWTRKEEAEEGDMEEDLQDINPVLLPAPTISEVRI